MKTKDRREGDEFNADHDGGRLFVRPRATIISAVIQLVEGTSVVPRFIHAADIHLDSPLRGLEAYEGAPVERLRGATRQALTQLVDLCLSERADFVVIAGDVFDADWKDFQTALFVTSELRRLGREGIPVFLIFGNHDSVEGMSKKTPWPSNVKVLDHKRPETARLDALRVAIHGRSFPRREVIENWVPDYPSPISGWFNLGLLHTNAGGNPNHDSYAPCAVSELASKGYSYWALGHVHDFAVLNEQPPVVYSGNLQGRHVREVGTKGCVVVEFEGTEVTSLEFRPTDVLRWSHEVIVVGAQDTRDELLEAVRTRLAAIQAAVDGRLAAVRLEFVGRCQLHAELVSDAERQQLMTDLRALASDLSDDIWIEKIKFRTESPLDLEQLRLRHDHVGELLRLVNEIANDPQRLREMAEELKPLATKVGGELKDEPGAESLQFDDETLLASWLRDAESLLVNRLVEAAS